MATYNYNWTGGGDTDDDGRFDLQDNDNWNQPAGIPGVPDAADNAVIDVNGDTLTGTLDVIQLTLDDDVVFDQATLDLSTIAIINGDVDLNDSDLETNNLNYNLVVDTNLEVTQGTITLAGTLIVGNVANNAGVQINSASTVSTPAVVIGNHTGAAGVVDVSEATLKTDSLTLGQDAGSDGELNLTAAATVAGLSAAAVGVIYIGLAGDGNLQVTLPYGQYADSSITADYIDLAINADSVGELTVGDVSIAVYNDLDIGVAGDGGNNGQNGLTETSGDIVAAVVTVAIAAHSTGNLTIDSILTVATPNDDGGPTNTYGPLTIGFYGDAWAEFNSGSQITAGNIDIAYLPHSNAVVTFDFATVTSQGSFTVADQGDVGDADTAGMTVNDYSKVTSQASYIGNQTGSLGNVLVDNATWTTNVFTVGGGFGGGTGYLTVQNGAHIVISGSGGEFIVGGNAQSNGNVTVSTSLLDDSGSANDQLIVGQAGEGALKIENHAVLKTQAAVIGNIAGSNGAVIIDDSVWSALNVTVGAGGAGNLAIQDAGNLATQNLWVGNNDNGQVNITGQSAVTAFNVEIGVAQGSVGEVDVTGSGTTLNLTNSKAADQIIVGNFGQGELIINQGATVTASTVRVGAGDADLLEVCNGAVLHTRYLGMGTGSTIDVTDPGGSVDIGSSAKTVAGALDVAASGSIVGAGTIEGNLIDDGSVTSDGGTLTITGAVTGSNTVSLTIWSGSTLELGGSDTIAVDFTPGAGTLKLDQPRSFTGQIDGFAAGDKIDLTDVGYSSGGTVQLTTGNVLNVSEGGNSYTFHLNPNASFAGDVFKLTSDGATGTYVVIATPATLSVSSVPNATRGKVIHLSSLVTISDPDNVGYQKLELYDTDGTVTGGQFKINGVAQTGGHEIDVTAANVPNTVFDAGTWGGTDTLYAWLLQDNGTLTARQPFTVTVPLPTVTVHNDSSATPGQIINLASLVTISDPGGVGYQKLELYDTNGTVAGGRFKINGVAQTGGHEIDVSPANVANTVFDAGTLGGTDTLKARLLQDNGTLTAWQQLTVKDALTIAAGATVEIPSAFAGAVTFAASTGTLQLDDPSSFSGTVAGMSRKDTIDLRDINPTAVHTPIFSGTSVGGTLHVTDGTHSANIALLGNYLASSFVASSDGHGGTNIVDPQFVAASDRAVVTQLQHT
jgi:T5SS/PEP-CTERM-associated repeat protein